MIKINCAHKKVVKISDLAPHPKNPNKHPQNQIDAFETLLENHGWRLPICVSNLSGFIVRGHLRYYTALKMGETKVPVDYQDYENEAMELADLTADNHIPEMAQMDEELLNDLLVQIKGMPDVDIAVTGYTDRDLERMSAKLKKKKGGKPEVEFSEELHESSNYIVLYFDNDIDWLQALTMFNLKTVKALDSRPGFEKMGIGRVMNGADALNRIMGE
jgi:hypothetical protein